LLLQADGAGEGAVGGVAVEPVVAVGIQCAAIDIEVGGIAEDVLELLTRILVLLPPAPSP
jgi:hypothetical protein